MSPAFVGSRAALAKKAAHGKPCTRCGLCCEAEICPTGQRVMNLGLPGPCPALVYDDKGSRCGLIDHPAQYMPQATARFGETVMRNSALLLIGSGVGCDARFNGEPADEAYYEYLDARTKDLFELTIMAAALWWKP